MLRTGHTANAFGQTICDSRLFPAFVRVGTLSPRNQTAREVALRGEPRLRDCVVAEQLALLGTREQDRESICKCLGQISLGRVRYG